MKKMIQVWDRYSQEPPLKQLARLIEVERANSHPSVPPHARQKIIFRDNTANEMTKSIIAFMGVIGGQAERVNSMGRQITQGNKTKWVYGTTTNGTADISATWRGKSVKIEVKATRGEKQSENQRQYQQAIEKAGGIYLIARSFDGFLHEFFKAVEGLEHGG